MIKQQQLFKVIKQILIFISLININNSFKIIIPFLDQKVTKQKLVKN